MTLLDITYCYSYFLCILVKAQGTLDTVQYCANVLSHHSFTYSLLQKWEILQHANIHGNIV